MVERNSNWLALVLAGAALSACGPPPEMMHPGVATVDAAALPLSVPDLTLSSAVLHVDHIELIGDVSSPMGRPPPPPEPGMADLDLLSAGVRFTFDKLPQGVYSRVQLVFSNVRLQGTWRGVPFHAQLVNFRGAPIDLRSTAGKELATGQNASFTITVDVGSWFAGNLLDSAMAANGELLCDDQHNVPVANELTARIAPSFSLQ